MKITLETKFNNVCHFLAPVRFQSHLSSLLKTLISIEKYHFIYKNVRSCADNVWHFLASVHFQSHLSALLKSLLSIEKYHFI